MNILLTGGSGLIGSRLAEKLIDEGHTIRILTREKDVEAPFYNWDKNSIDNDAFKDLDGIIHLAGATISKRWTASYKKEILDSRVCSAQLLYKYVKKNNVDLKFFISASGTGYYGQITSDKIFNENDKPGNDFLGNVCVEWENAAYKFQDFGSRVVCIRTSVVLSKSGGALELMKKPIQLGLGANLGNGKQWMPWIYIDDLVNIYAFAVQNNNMEGSYNAAAPEMIDYDEFNHKLAKKMKKPFFMPNVPSFLLHLFLGEMSLLVLKGSRMSSKKIEEIGFKFSYPNLDKALNKLV
ncbi:TIGR01777 family oxidoreductase [Chishuiella sp.]|uniref:TIGR01777 family oxidoreductase n=1 Tax=Chishuiella sp. TaxID=1969467 RepID=UPI0028B1C636|nr:TIGR01777 family oxidoreductase [Chishuiella sp.]